MFSRIATGLLVFFRFYQAQVLLIKTVDLNSIQSWILGIESKNTNQLDLHRPRRRKT